MTTVTTEATTGSVLVVDDHPQARQSMADILQCIGHTVQCCSSTAEALKKLESSSFDAILTDLRMPGMSGLDFIREMEQRRIESPTVMVTAYASVSTAVEAMRHGAFDYIEKPFDASQLEQLVRRAMQNTGERRSQIAHDNGQLAAMIGSSSVMQQLRDRIQQVAPTSETVLVTGESGVGKELVARAIHACSQRAKGPLVSLNCPALSPQLMESELFGHEQGAFTNADTPRIGRFELADGGTILLDEVTEINLPLQAKLLRVLQEKSFERVGASATSHTDVRVIATSNRELRSSVRAGEFREDLYFRLAVVPIHVAPLRDRREDVPQLIQHFADQAAVRVNKDPCELDASAMNLLIGYDWPGNIREMENLITRASVLSANPLVTADELRPWLMTSDDAENVDAELSSAMDERRLVGMNLQDMERRLIEATLEHYGGHREQTAQALGIGVRTLTNKMRSYGYAPRTKAFAKAA